MLSHILNTGIEIEFKLLNNAFKRYALELTNQVFILYSWRLKDINILGLFSF